LAVGTIPLVVLLLHQKVEELQRLGRSHGQAHPGQQMMEGHQFRRAGICFG